MTDTTDTPFATRMETYKRQIPDEHHDAFDEVVGQGLSPRGVVSAINWATKPMLSQPEAAERYNVSPATLRNARQRLEDAGYDIAADPVFGGKSRNELLAELADTLGWIDGHEYNESAGHVRMAGLHDLNRRLGDGPGGDR